MNYFKLLQIEQQYNINLKNLENNYFELLSKIHPDRAKTEQEKSDFLKYSIDINNAYDVLKSELKRAIYILSSYNIDIENAQIKNKFPADVLGRIWEDFEFVESTEEKQNLQKFKDQKLEEKQNIISKIAESFKEEEIEKATNQTIELRYLINIIDNINIKIKNVAD